MQLTAGMQAIDFDVKDIYGKVIKLSDFKGQKIILIFFRNVSCPFCSVQVHKLMSNSLKFERAGIKLVWFFESTDDQIKGSILHQGISPWPVIGDPEKKIYAKYGVETSVVKAMLTMVSTNIYAVKKEAKSLDYPLEPDPNVTKNLIPADFLIDANFTIVKAHYGKHLDDHLTIPELKLFSGVRY